MGDGGGALGAAGEAREREKRRNDRGGGEAVKGRNAKSERRRSS